MNEAVVHVSRRHRERGAPSTKREANGIEVLRYAALSRRQRRLLHQDFQRQILPALTPMALGPGHPFPRVSNQSINLAVMVKQPGHRERFGSLTVPQMFPRLWRIPGQAESNQFVWLEEMVAANIDSLFPGLEIVSISPFRITREAPSPAGGSTTTANRRPPVRTRHDRRRFDRVLRLEVERDMPRRMRDVLIQNLGISPDQAVPVDGFLH